MKNYVYPAVFIKDKENDIYRVLFPDIELTTDGTVVEEAFLYAKEFLKAYFVYIEKYDRIRYPQKAFKYDMSGNLVSVCLYISGAEQYVFRTNGEFVGHWKDDNYYNEKGELIYTRK